MVLNKDNHMKLLPLQTGILYGPINSRRLGKSLGINLMPTTYKACSFNCIYCHYGRTDVLTHDLEKCKDDLPTVTDIVAAVEGALASDVKFDYLTFSGNGEPTLYPDFETIVKHIVALRNTYQPALKIALLSNSSGVYRENVRRALAFIDMPVFKLDAGNAVMFEKVNRPSRDVQFGEIVQNLSTLKHIYLQTVLMYGDPSNAEAQELVSYYEAVARIRPKEVQIYSLDRPVSNAKIRRVLPHDLEETAAYGTRETGVPFHAYYL